MTTEGQADVALPRVAIKFCVQCKWNLRAAYYAQELLSTFSNTIGEVALIPVTGGIFTITLSQPAASQTDDDSNEIKETLLWDRKTEGGFPETKELKSRVRNLIDPSRDLGHVDRALKKSAPATSAAAVAEPYGSREITLVPNEADGASVTPTETHQMHKGTEDCEECKQAQNEDVTKR